VPTAPPISIRCTDASVTFYTGDRALTVLEDLTLNVPQGRFLTLLGPSGCGKSTLLRLVSGLVAPSAGAVEVLATTPAAARRRRDIGFVFQDSALLPWRTAIENVALPLEVYQEDPAQRTQRCEEILHFLGLEPRKHAYPHQLSGGMRQRVAIARALVSKPKILLMDEPFAALDEITRDRLNEELRRIWAQTGLTILFVTHAIDEAVYLGQRVLMLAANPGRILEDIPIDLPEDRTLAVREDPRFIALTTHLRAQLEAAS
jgi:NitT/TauT family transport system ATP-binding protein